VLLRAAAGGAGILCLLAGTVFLFQGIGVLGGSFMTGSTKWAVIGALLDVAGVGLLALARR
jgi:hypothetical protein